MILHVNVTFIITIKIIILLIGYMIMR